MNRLVVIAVLDALPTLPERCRFDLSHHPVPYPQCRFGAAGRCSILEFMHRIVDVNRRGISVRNKLITLWFCAIPLLR